MVTDQGLAALRAAATVNHLYPSLTTRLWAGGRQVVTVSAPPAGAGPGPWTEVGPRPGAEAAGEGLGLTPCGFRAATAQAWARHRAGHRLRLLDLDVDPSLEIDPAPGDRVWPNGVARVRTRRPHDTDCYVFGTFLGPDRCRLHARDLIDEMPAPEGILGLSLQRDTDTEVTVVAAEVDPDARYDVEADVLTLLDALVARFAVIELLDVVAPARSHP